MSHGEQIRNEALTQFSLGGMLQEVNPDDVHVNTGRLNRYVNHLIGLGELTVKAQSSDYFANKKGATQVAVERSDIDWDLPSSYQRPKGILSINGSSARAENDDEPSAQAQVHELDYAMRIGMVELFAARYNKLDSMTFNERILGGAPFWSSLLVETVGHASPLTAAAVYAGAYAVILAGDYHDAWRVLGKDASPSALNLKRWSLFPCGVPVERKMEVQLSTMGAFNANPRPTFVKYVGAA